MWAKLQKKLNMCTKLQFFLYLCGENLFYESTIFMSAAQSDRQRYIAESPRERASSPLRSPVMAQVAVTYDSVMNDLKARQFKPVYYLMGEESYYIDQISEWLANNVLQPEERDFNQTVLFGSDVTASQIVDAAKRYPMMAEYQVLIVKEAQNIRNTEPLEKYFKAPMPSTILVMCHKNGKVDGRKREYVKAIQQAGVTFALHRTLFAGSWSLHRP